MRTTSYNTTLRDFANMANAMNRVLERNWTGNDFARNGGHNGQSEGNGQQTASAVRLPVDVWVGDAAYTITAYLPGVQPEAVEITFEGENLTIRGQFPTPQADAQFLKRELFHGAFERSLTFNVPVNSDAIEASYENGLLTLVVPKAEEVKPKQIKVVAK